MTSYTTIVFGNGIPSYVAGRHADLSAANKLVTKMIAETYPDEKTGREKFVFDNDDDIVIIEAGNKPICAWNRHVVKDASDFAKTNFEAFLAHVAEREGRRIIGYQLCNEEGINIHGLENDPFDLNSFEVLKYGAVITAKAWADENGYVVRQVYEHDIENPSFVEEITVKAEVFLP